MLEMFGDQGSLENIRMRRYTLNYMCDKLRPHIFC